MLIAVEQVCLAFFRNLMASFESDERCFSSQESKVIKRFLLMLSSWERSMR